MAKRKKQEPLAGKPEPKAVFDAWFQSCTDAQRRVIFEVDSKLGLIQTDKKNLRRDLQPLRVGMELSKVKQIIVGRSGKANPQQETGRIWGAYRDSNLKAAGYSKSSCDTYIGMIEEARVILPSDELITALLDHTNKKGQVVMTGGNKEKPFGKFTMYLKSTDVQQHVKDGKVNLDDLTADDLIANVFDPENVETPETKLNMTVAVDTVVKRIFSELKTKILPKEALEPVIDEAQAISHSHKLVRYVIESLLTACNMEPLAFEPVSAEIIEDDEIITLSALITAANDDKKKKADSKGRKKKTSKKSHVRDEQPEAETELRPEGGKYVIRKNRNAQHFPMTPWEIFEDGKDKPVARCQDKLQAVEQVSLLLKKTGATPNRPTELNKLQEDAIRKQTQVGNAG
jgi:hypothetical protein